MNNDSLAERTGLRSVLFRAALSILICGIGVVVAIGLSGRFFPSQQRDGNGSVPAAADYLVDDPANDGWTSEVLHGEISRQLGRLREVMEHPDEVADSNVIEDIVGSRFTGTDLRPSVLTEVSGAGGMTIRRPSGVLPVEDGLQHVGSEGLRNVLFGLLEPMQAADRVRVKLKTYRLLVQDGKATTTVAYEALARGAGGSTQQTGSWTCQWELPETGDAAPRLVSLEAASFEEVSARGDETTTFLDCTESVFSGNPSFEEYIAVSPMRRQGIVQFGRRGISLGDVNSDGLDDLYLPQEFGVPNLLYLRNPDGTLTDVSAEYGVDLEAWSMSALFIDVDNDSDQDLIVNTHEALLFFENIGGKKFLRRFEWPTPAFIATSMSAADFDLDGDIDVYLCGYNTVDPAPSGMSRARLFSNPPTPIYDANNGAPNALLRNNGQWKFEDITQSVGLDVHNRRWSYAAAWEDYDNDGDQDLYVANDFGRNCLYRNDRGRFIEVAAEAGAEDIGAGMGVTWGDFDNDGWVDIHVSNMFSSAGNRIVDKPGFHTHGDAGRKDAAKRFARGNSLFRNNRDGTFTDVTIPAAINMAFWAWGSSFGDINNDTLPDIVVANGLITQEDTGDL